MEKAIDHHWFKVSDAATYAGVSSKTLRRFLKRGLIHSRLPTGTILINRRNIDIFIGSFAVDALTEQKGVEEINSIVDEVCRGF